MILVKLFIIVSLTFSMILCDYTQKQKESVYDLWWVWELGEEGTVKTIEPIEESNVADNNKVMGLIKFPRETGRSLQIAQAITIKNYKTNATTKKTVFQQQPNGNQRQNKAAWSQNKLVVILQKKPQSKEIAVDRTHCGTCTWSYRLNDVKNADAVVIEDSYMYSNKIPKRR